MNKQSKIRIVHLFMPGLAALFRTAQGVDLLLFAPQLSSPALVAALLLN